MKSALKDILATKEEVVGYSIAGQLRKYLPEFARYYFREQDKSQIIHRFIYTSGIPQPPSKYYQIRFLPKGSPAFPSSLTALVIETIPYL